MKMTVDNYIQIPNVAFAFGTEYKLNDDELNVFAYLQFMKNVGTMNIRTHVTIIVEDLGWMTSKASRDNAKAGKALEGLRDKGYITLSFDGDIKKNALAININDEMKSVVAEGKVDWKEKPFKFSGYTEIKANEYNLAEENDYHLAIMTYHKWRGNLEEKYGFKYDICDKEWCEVLELGMTRTREIINDCTFLTKVSGKKYQDENGQWKQETNHYVKSVSVKTDLKEIDTANKNLSFLEREREKVTDLLVKSDDVAFGQIFDKTKRFEFEGYKAWKETTCDYVKKAGEKKFEILEKAGQSWIREQRESEYQERLENKKIIHIMMDNHMNDYEENDYEEFKTSYRQKRIKEENFFDECM